MLSETLPSLIFLSIIKPDSVIISFKIFQAHHSGCAKR